ncbi:MAG: hypothetical protein ACI3XR_04995 [Eubacteriales bacterium]
MKSGKKVKRMVLSAIFSALGVVLLWLGGMLGDLDLSMAAIVSLIVVLAAIEMGLKYAFAVYLVTSALALILFPSYFITPIYVLFIGYYPIAKSLLEKLPKVLSFICKLILMNGMLTLICFIGSRLFGLEEDIAIWILYILGNVAFIIFDIALSLLISLYYARFRKILGIQKMLK